MVKTLSSILRWGIYTWTCWFPVFLEIPGIGPPLLWHHSSGLPSWCLDCCPLWSEGSRQHFQLWNVSTQSGVHVTGQAPRGIWVWESWSEFSFDRYSSPHLWQSKNIVFLASSDTSCYFCYLRYKRFITQSKKQIIKWSNGYCFFLRQVWNDLFHNFVERFKEGIWPLKHAAAMLELAFYTTLNVTALISSPLIIWSLHPAGLGEQTEI